MKTTFSALVALSVVTVGAVRIDIPPGKTFESVISIGGNIFLASDVITGNIMRLNSKTGILSTVVRAPSPRMVQGLHYDAATNYIFAAGSGNAYSDNLNTQLNGTENVLDLEFPYFDPTMHVYDMTSGKEIATCPGMEGGLVNDVTVDPMSEYAYFTDSKLPILHRMKISSLPECETDTIEMPPEFVSERFTGAGIVYYNGGLIVSNFFYASIYFVDLETGEISVIVETGTYGGMDGIRLEKNCLLAASNDGSVINMFKLKFKKKTRKIKVNFTGRLSSEDFTELTSIALGSGKLVATNNDMEILGNEGQLWITVEDKPDLCDG